MKIIKNIGYYVFKYFDKCAYRSNLTFLTTLTWSADIVSRIAAKLHYYLVVPILFETAAHG